VLEKIKEIKEDKKKAQVLKQVCIILNNPVPQSHKWSQATINRQDESSKIKDTLGKVSLESL